jgi:hypothetical protein
MKYITNKNGKKQQKAKTRKHKLAEQANDDQPAAENEVKMVEQKPGVETEDDGNNAKNKKGDGNNHMEVYIFQIRKK